MHVWCMCVRSLQESIGVFMLFTTRMTKTTTALCGSWRSLVLTQRFTGSTEALPTPCGGVWAIVLSIKSAIVNLRLSLNVTQLRFSACCGVNFAILLLYVGYSNTCVYVITSAYLRSMYARIKMHKALLANKRQGVATNEKLFFCCTSITPTLVLPPSQLFCTTTFMYTHFVFVRVAYIDTRCTPE